MWLAEQEAGIDEIVVSSTSTCTEMYKLVVKEMRELIRIGGSSIHPILWLTPRMMKTWGLSYMLHSKIKWQGIKMHWMAHREWYYNEKLLRNALEIARWLQVPVLFHTGEYIECKASVFMNVCKQNDDLTFVLAHGRPVDETIEVLASCPNVYVDTAFMPALHVKLLTESGFASRVLLGTDAPINLQFDDDTSTVDYLKNYLSQLQIVLSDKEYNQIITNNIYK